MSAPSCGHVRQPQAASKSARQSRAKRADCMHARQGRRAPIGGRNPSRWAGSRQPTRRSAAASVHAAEPLRRCQVTGWPSDSDHPHCAQSAPSRAAVAAGCRCMECQGCLIPPSIAALASRAAVASCCQTPQRRLASTSLACNNRWIHSSKSRRCLCLEPRRRSVASTGRSAPQAMMFSCSYCFGKWESQIQVERPSRLCT